MSLEGAIYFGTQMFLLIILFCSLIEIHYALQKAITACEEAQQSFHLRALVWFGLVWFGSNRRASAWKSTIIVSWRDEQALTIPIMEIWEGRAGRTRVRADHPYLHPPSAADCITVAMVCQRMRCMYRCGIPWPLLGTTYHYVYVCMYVCMYVRNSSNVNNAENLLVLGCPAQLLRMG